ncbi:MAG: NAD-dependent epimerase/dehydratase family protein, partial [Candidatus Peregrinibacteria bacterium]|nr:NAD-dependent epimerase/dehydratase family protein [Candidatus Peregrinibacteria bacterium]
MKILITGGAGFIGSNLAKFYSERGFEVAVLDNFSTGRRDFLEGLDVTIFEADICDRKAVREAFESFKPDIVSHHAAHISVRVSFDKPYFDAEKNILGSINIFENAGKVGVKNVIFASTGGAMVPSDNEVFPTPEFENPEVESPYAISKFCAEKYLRHFAKQFGFSGTIFRYANVYGPHQTPKSEAGVISIFSEKMANGQTSTIFGDGKQTRDFVFVEDLCEAHFAATDKNISGTFHIGTGIETSVLEIYKGMAEIADFS